MITSSNKEGYSKQKMITSSNKEGYSKYPYQPYNYGWSTTSPDYHAHFSSSESLPTVVTGFPQYPNANNIFNNKVTSYEEESPHRMNQGHDYYEDESPRRMNQGHDYYEGVAPRWMDLQHHAPQARKKVHFVEQEKTTQVVYADDNNKKWKNVYGESIDAEADGFIKQKHNKFEFAKWETFKEY